MNIPSEKLRAWHDVVEMASDLSSTGCMANDQRQRLRDLERTLFEAYLDAVAEEARAADL